MELPSCFTDNKITWKVWFTRGNQGFEDHLANTVRWGCGVSAGPGAGLGDPRGSL